jgi:hypothetical protein
MLKQAEKVHAAAVKMHKKAKPVFEKAEHSAAVSYALHELSKFLGFAYAHELVMASAGLVLVSLAVMLLGRGMEMMLIALGFAIRGAVEGGMASV